MKSLAQLRAEQQAAGVKPEVDADGVAVGPPVVYTKVVGSSVPEPASRNPADYQGEAGFLRILPPTFTSVSQASEAWRSEFWTVPSPWCRIEGQPDHPDFEKNLTAFEQS